MYGYKLWKLAIVCACIVLCLWVVCGCMPIESGVARGGGSIANPGADFTLDLATGKARFTTNRDDKCTIGPIDGQPGQGIDVMIPSKVPGPLAGATVKTGPITIDASASKVRRANSGQLESFAVYKEAEGEAVANVIEAGGEAITDVVGAVSRLRKSEKSNQGYQVIFALFAFVLAMFCLIVFIALVAYGVKKLFAVLFPPKPSTSSDPLISLLAAAFANKGNA